MQPLPQPPAVARILLTPDMVVNESGLGDPKRLVDEQAAVGDPAAGKGQRPEKPYFPGWAAWQYPVHAIVDLGAPHRLTRAFLYNESGTNAVTVSTGDPLSWTARAVTLDGFQAWKEIPLDGVVTRFVRITLTKPTSLPELVLYGQRLATPAARPRPKTKPRSRPTMDRFVGANAFIDDPKERLAVVAGYVREYHNWSWDTEAPDGKLRFQPSGAAGGDAWFFDNFYARLKALGVSTVPALQQLSPVAFPGRDAEAKPAADGMSPEDPAAYAAHARYVYQFAARYGARKVPDARIDLGPGQPRRSGLGLLDALENWNEPNKTWRGRAGYFAPFELAAMCSADRDAIRAADPRMRLSVGGLVGAEVEYFRAMALWAEFHRGGDFPADILNVHLYAGDGDAEQAFKTTGISPEAGKLREKVAALTAWRDTHLPDREVWVTEFGWDTDPRSPLHAPAIGRLSAERVQAAWLVRAFLGLAAAGADRAAMFMFRDVKTGGPGVFETCGLVTEKGAWKPKPSYFAVAALRRRLAGMRFDAEIPTGRSDVTALRFVGGGRTVYALWCPTSEDKTVAGFTLRLPARARAATRVRLASETIDGVAEPLPVAGGAVRVDVSEEPTLILTR